VEPMKPMEPMKPFATPATEVWWPHDMGHPSASGSQNGMRYAFFSQKRRLMIERDTTRTVYDSGDHVITGVAQSSDAQSPVFTSQKGPVELSELRQVG
jgi:hypothetical protein